MYRRSRHTSKITENKNERISVSLIRIAIKTKIRTIEGYTVNKAAVLDKKDKIRAKATVAFSEENKAIKYAKYAAEDYRYSSYD
ncbi:hypothetical protein N7523_008397 [Penicillium sp. IBT 18751x]|nr:hypothetical protein N7523_008397 [Penicillium sp. IBT 18751x]